MVVAVARLAGVAAHRRDGERVVMGDALARRRRGRKTSGPVYQRADRLAAVLPFP
jgi:hypothetical protein